MRSLLRAAVITYISAIYTSDNGGGGTSFIQGAYGLKRIKSGLH